jgi:two-component system, OmpR family, response regulator RegX3
VESHGEDTAILLVEDDREIATQAVAGLKRYGFVVRHVVTGRSALKVVLGEVDVVVLDLGLPDLDGTEVCRRIRSRSAVPIIVLSARSEERDRVDALESGADDYVTKPYGLRELVARIHAVLRRTQRGEELVVQVGDLRLDRVSRRVLREGAEIPLTLKEFDLLATLMAHPDEVVPRRHLLDEVWGNEWHGTGRTLDVHVNALRRKLGAGHAIETVRGVGLRLRPRR